MLNDKFLSGKENDLSMFGIDLSVYRDIEINVKDSLVSVSIDNKTVFEDFYKSELGDFVGLRYRFLGAGEVSHLQISNSAKDSILGFN